MEVVRRAFLTNFETREENGSGIVEGRPVVFNSPTDLGFCDEVIAPDALRNTDLTDVRLCLNHDTSFVYARSRRNNANSTMQIMTDALGLNFRAALDIENSPKAQDYYAAVKRGDIDKMSFMFTVDGVEWENLESEHPTRRITSIGKIFEISAVTFPAYDTTSIEARDAQALESVKRELESARAELRTPLDSGTLAEIELAKAKYFYTRRKTK
jgi:HK97 family phage prohead protease